MDIVVASPDYFVQAVLQLSANGTDVTLDTVLDEVLRMKFAQCRCLVNLRGARDAIAHIMFNWNMPIHCHNVEDVAEMFAMNHAYPDHPDMLTAYRTSREEFLSDPAAYCEKTRIMLSTPNLDQLKAKILDDVSNQCCSICQSDLAPQTPVFELPRCKHLFHARAAQCLGSGQSILTWLDKHKKCPNCNVEVVIPRASVENKKKRKFAPRDPIMTRSKRARQAQASNSAV